MAIYLQIKVNGKRTYFGTFATKEEAEKKRAEVRGQFPEAGVGKKKGQKDPKVKCPSCSNQISIHRVSAHYKACRERPKK